MSQILLIEDDTDLVQLFGEALEMAGFSVIKFTDPVKACEKFEANPYAYDLVLSDIRMPGMSGLDLVKRIRKFNNDVNVVLMTAFETNDIESELKELSLDAFLKKPVHIDQLIIAIKKCIGNKPGWTSAAR